MFPQNTLWVPTAPSQSRAIKFESSHQSKWTDFFTKLTIFSLRGLTPHFLKNLKENSVVNLKLMVFLHWREETAVSMSKGSSIRPCCCMDQQHGRLELRLASKTATSLFKWNSSWWPCWHLSEPILCGSCNANFSQEGCLWMNLSMWQNELAEMNGKCGKTFLIWVHLPWAWKAC